MSAGGEKGCAPGKGERRHQPRTPATCPARPSRLCALGEVAAVCALGEVASHWMAHLHSRSEGRAVVSSKKVPGGPWGSGSPPGISGHSLCQGRVTKFLGKLESRVNIKVNLYCRVL